MCLVIDTCCLGVVFDGRNKKHQKFAPVLEWINGHGRMIYGGTKYNEELRRAAKFLPYIAELSRKRHAIQVPNAEVDAIAAELKVRHPEREFDDEHLVALVIASRCRVVCRDDNAAIAYLKRPDLFLGYCGVVRPKIYRGYEVHAQLCCDDHVVGLCREHA
jgi:hypothetical protein